ncbi:MAG TPA: type IV toxin-antitoxin system AbiEi family antitoxin domain-containing protein [Thermoleophilaceae bacterium]|nr:type IV toxin-antitoxin system AbiEi family antitoxin domain-containing protein [Thermoleophilaceae bacterium]
MVDRRAAALAAGQFGVVTYAQLLACGLTRHRVEQRVRARQLQRLWRGVYAFGHRELTARGMLLAAVLACGPGARLSHRLAAHHSELLAFGPANIDVTVPTKGGRPRRQGINLHCCRFLDPRDLMNKDGIPITTPARTLVDLSGIVPARQLERAFEQARIRRLIRPGELEDALGRAAGRNTRALRMLLDAEKNSTTFTRSDLEERFLALIRSAGLPEPEVNARLHGYEVDFLWREQRRVIEVDGYAYHSTRQAANRDRRKDNDLELAGFPVTRFTGDQVMSEPHETLERARRVVLGQ